MSLSVGWFVATRKDGFGYCYDMREEDNTNARSRSLQEKSFNNRKCCQRRKFRTRTETDVTNKTKKEINQSGVKGQTQKTSRNEMRNRSQKTSLMLKMLQRTEVRKPLFSLRGITLLC